MIGREHRRFYRYELTVKVQRVTNPLQQLLRHLATICCGRWRTDTNPDRGRIPAPR